MSLLKGMLRTPFDSSSAATLSGRLFIIVLATFAALSIHKHFEESSLTVSFSPPQLDGKVDLTYVVAHITASVVIMGGVVVAFAFQVELSVYGTRSEVGGAPKDKADITAVDQSASSPRENTHTKSSNSRPSPLGDSHSVGPSSQDHRHPEARQRMASRMVGYVNHELRNPLNGVMGLVELAIGSLATCIAMAQTDHADSERETSSDIPATPSARPSTTPMDSAFSGSKIHSSTSPATWPASHIADSAVPSTVAADADNSSGGILYGQRASASLPERLSLIRADLVAIDRLCQLLKLVVDDVREIRRFEDGALVITPAPVCLRSVLGEVVAVMQPKLSEKPFVNVSVEFSDKSLEENPVICDPLRLKQVLLNLLSNAIRHSDRGTINVTVSMVDESSRDASSTPSPTFTSSDSSAASQQQSDLQALVAPSSGAGKRIRFAVTDNGYGISPDKQRLLFEPFHPDYEKVILNPGGKNSNKYAGTGLGLYLCGLLAKLMGGSINFVSTEGRGSSFWIDIPASFDESTGRSLNSPGYAPDLSSLNSLGMSPASAVKIARQSHAHRTERETDTSQHQSSALGSESSSLASASSANVKTGCASRSSEAMLVSGGPSSSSAALPSVALRPTPEVLVGTHHLVVDDDRINRTVLRRYLEGAGIASVDEAENGLEALRLATSRQYDYVWIDMKMPIMGGLEATRRIRLLDQRSASIPIIGVTGDVTESDVKICREAGMTAVMSKPISRARVFSMADSRGNHPTVSLDAIAQ
eukprot:Opistho-2@18599